MEWIADFLNNFTSFFQDVWNWIYTGIYDLLKSFLVTITKAMIYAYFQSIIFAAEIAYTVVQELLQETGVIDQVQQAYSAIPAEVRDILTFFNIPQGLGMIFTAIPTRIAMRFIPIFGR